MPRSGPRWTEFGRELAAFERWLLPGECLLCKGAVEPDPRDPLVCAPCRARWTPLPHPQCPRCGQPTTNGVACRLCADWPPGLAGVRSAVWLGDTARQAVHLFKYQGWRRLAESFAVTLRRIVSIPPGSVLVPIPLGAARLKVRGYNQSAELAASLGQLFRLSVAPDVLRRRRETGTQTVLTPEARRANLAGAFVAAGQVPRTAVLVDDVFTTGATLFEAAGALLQGGASRVSAVTFARAPLPLADALAAAEA